MLKQEQALPSAKLHFSINNWHCFARSRQDHANMRWHVIAAFGAVTKVIGIFWDETIEEFLQIMSRGWISIFHDDNAATGVLNKNRHCSIAQQAALVDPGLDVVGDFVHPPASGGYFESVVVYAHWAHCYSTRR